MEQARFSFEETPTRISEREISGCLTTSFMCLDQVDSALDKLHGGRRHDHVDAHRSGHFFVVGFESLSRRERACNLASLTTAWTCPTQGGVFPIRS